LQRVEQGFIKDEGKTERIQAAVYGLMGTLLWDEPGSRDKAAEYYQRCYDIVEPLYRAMPERDKAKKNFGVATFHLGNVSLAMRNNPQDAKRRYEEALTLLDELAEKSSYSENLTTTEVQLALDEVLRKLVSVQFALGNPAAARPYAERSLAIAQKVLDQEPEKPDLMHAPRGHGASEPGGRLSAPEGRRRLPPPRRGSHSRPRGRLQGEPLQHGYSEWSRQGLGQFRRLPSAPQGCRWRRTAVSP
jgi:tetratricopeptide (TPR) repeat protein